MPLEELNRRVRAATKPITPSANTSTTLGWSGAPAARITSSTTCRSTTGTRVLTPAQTSPATNVRARLARCASTKGSMRRIQPPRTRPSAIGEPFHQPGGQAEQLAFGRRAPLRHRLGQPRLSAEGVLLDHGGSLVGDHDPHLAAVLVIRAPQDQSVV